MTARSENGPYPPTLVGRAGSPSRPSPSARSRHDDAIMTARSENGPYASR